MLRPARVRRDEGQVDLVLLGGRERYLRFLRFFLNPLDRVGLLRQVDAAVFLELANDPIDQDVVPIVAAKMGVAVSSLYFKDAVPNLENGNVERAAAQIIHSDLFVLLLVEAVSKRSGSRLIDDTQHFQARDLTRVFGRVTL